jgi:hypothetical protein
LKRTIFSAALLAVIGSVNSLYGQASPAASTAASAAPATRSEVYTITFMHAAPGKAGAMEDWGKKAASSSDGGTRNLTLRHQSGSPWDYVAITHEGVKATVDPAGNPQGAALRPLMDWHDDTFASGLAWAEFAKEMDLDASSGKPKTKESVYVISVYRPVVGQDEALDKFLNEAPPAGDLTAGNVVLQHLEGGAWRFCSIGRYKNYADYATSEAKAVADTAKNGSAGWFRLRELSSYHNDTLATAVSP